MSKRIFPNWNTFGATRDKAWLAKQAAARAAARSTVVQNARGNVLPQRLPITIPRRMFAPRPGELKTVDIPYTSIMLGVPTTSIHLLNGIVSGANFYNRIGNKVTPQSSDLDIILVNNSTTATSLAIVRVALIWDKQPTGALPTYSDIFQNIDSVGNATSTGFSGRNLQTTDRFSTISSQDIVIPSLNAASGGVNYRRLKFIRSLSGLHQQFKGNTAAIGDISSGALYLVVYSPTNETNTVSFYFDHRYRYYDN